MEKNITFEEEKRKEFLYVLFNALFVCTCIVFVLNFLSGALADTVYAKMSPRNNELFHNIFREFLFSASLIVPFIVYSKRSDISVKNIFIPRKKSLLFYIFGTVAVVGVSFPLLFLNKSLVLKLGEFGYVTHDYLPYDFDSPMLNIISMIFICLLSAASNEIVLRGMITERFRRANIGLALILPALIAMGFSGSLIKMPYVFVSSVVLSWVYMKTASVYVTFTAAFVRDLLMYVYFIYGEQLSAYIPVICIAGLAAAVISVAILVLRYGLKTVYPAPRDDDDEYLRLSAKESVSGLLKSFAFWIFVFGSFFTILFFYLSNPTIVGP